MKNAQQMMPDEEWWVDYMEGEMSPSTKEVLDLLIQYSVTDRKILKNLQSTKTMVEGIDPINEYTTYFSDVKIFNTLHFRILSEIEKVEDAKAGGYNNLPEDLQQKWWVPRRRT